jgi:GTPase
MFIDRAKINVKAGNGGDGSASFRREKFVPKGGPDGGDGGRGGSVYLRVNPDLNTLLPFHYKQNYKAEQGGGGRGQKMQGKAGSDLYIDVPPGTFVEIIDEDPMPGSASEGAQEVTQMDLLKPGQTLLVARGGRGGLGNVHFTTSTHQAPRYAEKGEPGEERTIAMELKLLADVGLVGYPNVGKSTLLSQVSAARPKVGDYPFTTLAPMLGVVQVSEEETLVMADIPGLIEGASGGAGLGLEFLRHVERTRLLLHLVDGSAGLWRTEGEEPQEGEGHPSQTTDPIADFKRINLELERYDETLASRPQIVAVNKIDIPEVRERIPALTAAFNEMGYPDVHPISAATGEGVRELIFAVAERLRELPKPEWQSEEAEDAPTELPVIRPHTAREERAFEVVQEEKGRFRVFGQRIERLVTVTDMGNPFALERLDHEMEKMGITEALREAGVEAGDTVAIARAELEWSSEPWEARRRDAPRRPNRGGGKKRS